MKITYNWLNQYVDYGDSPEQLGEDLTMLGLEVESLERVGGGYEGIVVGEVVTRDTHPNADRLSVCRVRDGEGERQIVCGATNFKVGDKVPLILPGAQLPTGDLAKPFVIKVGKIRGVESHGMMCSGNELGASDDSDGLMILDPVAEVGQSFASYMGIDDVDYVYDIEITPNRPDWNSVIGIAREISALKKIPLRLPEITLQESGGEIDSQVRVNIEDPSLCGRYTARLLRGLSVGPSPSWLKNSLENVGIRSINNVVDVTNFVMLEVGQPLHAFDFHLLTANSDHSATVVVRPAHDGESFVTLDEKEHELPSRAVMIADEQKAIALGGIMGGLNSEIGDATKDVLLESAWFNPQNIRATSKQLDARTDASYRFERGGDIEIADWASRRAAALIQELAGGELQRGVVDAYPGETPEREIVLRYAKTNELLGITIPAEEQRDGLERLELKVLDASESEVRFGIPSYRVDLKREVDLIEEVARLYGVDKIPATPPRGAIGFHEHDRVHDELAEVREHLVGMGLSEIQGQTLISDRAVGIPAGTDWVALEHPLSSDMNILRPSLLPGLVTVLQHNANHGTQDVAIFEVGGVFRKNNEEPVEARRLAVAITGAKAPGFWMTDRASGDCDVFDLKGYLEVLLERLGLRGLLWRRAATVDPLFVEAGEIGLGKQVLGRMGQMQPVTAAKLDLKKPVFLAELDLDLLLVRRHAGRSFKALAQFPSVRRDVAMLVDEGVTHEDVLREVKKAKAPLLQGVELFDVFRGKGIPEGKKSVAYAFVYRHQDRTLKDDEVTAAHSQIVERLKASAGAEIR